MFRDNYYFNFIIFRNILLLFNVAIITHSKVDRITIIKIKKDLINAHRKSLYRIPKLLRN